MLSHNYECRNVLKALIDSFFVTASEPGELPSLSILCNFRYLETIAVLSLSA